MLSSAKFASLTALFAVSALAGCQAGQAGMDRAGAMMGNAPDWFDEKRTEIRGEAYPDISAVPELRPEQQTGAEAVQASQQLTASQRAFFNSPRAQPASMSPAEVRALADRLTARVAVPPARDQLSREEQEAIREVFDTPRAQLPGG